MENFKSLDQVLDFERTPLAERNMPGTPYEIFRTSAAAFKELDALEFFFDARQFEQSVTFSYQELFENINRAANMFRSKGLGRSDVVAFILPNLPDTHYVIWGGEASGVVLSLNPLLEKEQLSALMTSAKVKWVVTLAPFPGSDLWQKVVHSCQENSQLAGVFQVNLLAYLQGKPSFSNPDEDSLIPCDELSVPVYDFHKEMAKHSAKEPEFTSPMPDDFASCFCTGGTTGLPKIAKRSHQAEVYNAWALTKMFQSTFTENKSIFCGLPLFHVNGQILTGLTPWLTGGKVILGTPQGYRSPELVPNFWKIVEHYRVSLFSGVPTLYANLVKVPVHDLDISSLESAICGAAPMPKELFNEFQDVTGVSIIEGYGLTEGVCASSVNPGLGENTIGSIGLRLPYQDMRALVLDENGSYQRDADVNEIGSICITGPNLFMGYMEPSHDKGVWIDRGGERWLNTGDLGRQDDKGFFWLTGRKKELIIRGGHNIDPKSLEEAMHKHPDVRLAAAVARPDAYAGELPVVYVELNEGSDISEAKLLEFAQSEIFEKAAWPKSITVVEKIPVTPVGKIFKPALYMREVEQIVRVVAAQAEAIIDQLDVRQDDTRGVVAHLKVKEINEELQHRLNQYTFQHELSS